METLTVYFDYTCQYSYRAMHWLDRAREARPELTVHWATFSLKEVNREEDEPSWVTADSPPSIGVFAQALAHAAREADFDLQFFDWFVIVNHERCARARIVAQSVLDLI